MKNEVELFKAKTDMLKKVTLLLGRKKLHFSHPFKKK